MTDSMIALTLTRIEQNDLATFGRIEDTDHQQWCVTLERPWLDNAHDVSCVPAGTYTAHRYASPKRGYDVFMLSGVPNRGDIELHIGNTVADSEGCILLGTMYGVVNGQHGITGSGDAFRAFMRRLQGVDAFTLTIVDPQPTVLAA